MGITPDRYQMFKERKIEVVEKYKDELWNAEPVDEWVAGWLIACVNKRTLRVDALITLDHEKKKKLVDGGFSFRYAFDYYQTEVAPERAKRGNKQSKRVLKMDPDKYYFIECAGSGSSAWIWDEEMKVYPMFNIVTTGDRWSPEEKCFYNKKSEKKWEQYPSWIWHPENGGPHNNLLPVCYPEPPVPEPLNRGDGFDWEWVEEAVAWMNVWWRDEIDEAELFIEF